MNKYEFLIRLSMVEGQKLAKIKKLKQPLPDKVNPSELLKTLSFSQEQQSRFKSIDQRRLKSTLNWLEKNHHHLIDYNDPNYPPLLKQISAAPLLLFIIGDPLLLHTPQIAMVGSRQFSEYGAQWGRYFASELATNGITITSGLALGIDGICHRGALEVSGKTIAVLGSGLAHITPQTNYKLAQDIIHSQGAIISEFLPNEAAKPQHFPRRNRIISGLSLGTFVVEASHKSGSLITARYALEQNRDVFALPGEIGNMNNEGTHWLIQQGAYLVTQPTDILEHLNGGLHWLPNNDEIKNSPQLSASLDITENTLPHPEILALIHYHPIPTDQLAELIDLPIPEISIKLLDLELSGAIKTVTGGYIRNRTK